MRASVISLGYICYSAAIIGNVDTQLENGRCLRGWEGLLILLCANIMNQFAAEANSAAGENRSTSSVLISGQLELPWFLLLNKLCFWFELSKQDKKYMFKFRQCSLIVHSLCAKDNKKIKIKENGTSEVLLRKMCYEKDFSLSHGWKPPLCLEPLNKGNQWLIWGLLPLHLSPIGVHSHILIIN